MMMMMMMRQTGEVTGYKCSVQLHSVTVHASGDAELSCKVTESL